MARRSSRVPAFLFVVSLLVGFANFATAEDGPIEQRIADALTADGIDGLETLLRGVDDANERTAVRRALAKRHVAVGDPFPSLEHWETLADGGAAADRIGYAEALIRVARQNLATGNARASGVVTYLIDARRTLEGLAAPENQPALGARLVLARAESWFYEGRLEETTQALGDVNHLEADFRPAAHALLAQVRYRQGDYAGAASAFESAGQMTGAAAAWAAAKEGEKAAAAYGALLAERPADLDLLRQALAAARYAGGTEALDATLAAADVTGPIRAAYLVARSDLASMRGGAASALPLLEEAVALDESSSEALVRIARIALTSTDMPEATRRARAAEVLLQALERTPEHPQVVNSLWHIAGRDYKEMWRSAGHGEATQRTLRIQRALVDKAPDDATGWANLGNTLRVAGETEEALGAYVRARRENEWDPSIASDHGLALSAAGRDEEALAAYLASIALDDGHLAGRQNAARAFWRTQRDDEADAHLSTALRKARAVDRNPMTYRFLLDRVWRSRQDEALR